MMDEAAFRRDLASDAFQAGILEGFWSIPPEGESIAWPAWLVSVKSNLESVPSGSITLRFNLDGYPAQAPTSVPWDLASNSRLNPAHWPKGDRTVTQAFNPGWNAGTCLYVPCDRGAMVGHECWKTQHPDYYWQPTFTIVRYLQCVRRCLNPFRYETTHQ